jgi:hypothetical protein
MMGEEDVVGGRERREEVVKDLVDENVHTWPLLQTMPGKALSSPLIALVMTGLGHNILK